MTPIQMRRAWNQVSAHYQRRHAIPTNSAHYGPWAPLENELRLLGDVRGRRILEVGCGGGQCSIAFAKQGALAAGLALPLLDLAGYRPGDFTATSGLSAVYCLLPLFFKTIAAMLAWRWRKILESSS